MSSPKEVDSSVSPDVVVDAKDVYSPIPLLRLKKELAIIKSGQIVQIDCTYTDLRTDIINWCESSKNNYLGEKDKKSYTSYYIKKSTI